MPTGPPKFELDKDGYPKMAPGRSGTMMMNGRARWQAVNESMESVAQRLSAALGRPVTDATGLKGKYDFTLLWSSAVSGMSMMGPMGVGMPPPPPPPAGAGPGGPEGGGGGAPMASMDDSGPTLQGAMQQQLGLRLESKKGMVDIVVVDRVEKVPTEN